MHEPAQPGHMTLADFAAIAAFSAPDAAQYFARLSAFGAAYCQRAGITLDDLWRMEATQAIDCLIAAIPAVMTVAMQQEAGRVAGHLQRALSPAAMRERMLQAVKEAA